MGVAKFGKRGGRSGIQKGAGKGTGGNYAGIGGGCLGHRTGRRGKLRGLSDALGTGGRQVNPAAPVVIHGTNQVPTINAVGIPRVPLVWCFVHGNI